MKVFLSGYGRMGRLIEQLALEKGWEIVGKADIDCPEVYETAPGADICIDFSGAGAMPKLLAYLRRTKTPLLSGTTGLTEPDLDALYALRAILNATSAGKLPAADMNGDGALTLADVVQILRAVSAGK